MLKVSEKNTLQRVLFGKIGLIVSLVVFTLLAKATWGVYQKSQFAHENRERAERELNTLEERETALKNEMDRLETKRGLESEIREKYDVGREGEHMVVLIDAPEPEAAPVTPESNPWQSIIRFFGF